MRKCLMISICYSFQFFFTGFIIAQENTGMGEQWLENTAEQSETSLQDDNHLQLLEHYRRTPLNLNTATLQELQELMLLTPLQIGQFIQYRSLLGLLLSRYELQAIPGWDLATIEALFPYITVTNTPGFWEVWKVGWKAGGHQLIVRTGFSINERKHEDYVGSTLKAQLRYRYQYKNNLQYGLLAKKDAGEHWWGGSQPRGFGFYSGHAFIRNIGAIRALAVGDFTVNMGQGLLIWQSLALGKGADVLQIRRQSAVLRPYHAAGEYNFHRGLGGTLGIGRWELTAFASIRHLDGNRVQDTVTGYYYISSLNSSGLHRTANELADRGSQQQITLGASCRYHHNLIQWGVNTVHYRFSLPFLPGKGLHNIYALAGKAFSAASVDFNYTHRNIHVFGEAALAKGVKPAVLIGGLISLSSTTDVSWLFRHLPPNFQPLQANAFTENTVPTNESGSYTGICIRPAPGWRIDAYADLFRFPWLRFTTRSPAGGTDYLLHLSYKPDKVLEMSVRFRSQQKDQMNSNDGIFPIPANTCWKRTQLRAQLQYRISAVCELRCRADWCKVGEEGSQAEQGILLYSDLQIHPPQKKWSVTARLQYFETEGYDSRLYAYEKDVLLSFSIPAFYGRGLRHFLLFRYAGQKRWTCWARIAQTIPISSTGNETQSGTVNPVNCTIQIQYRF